LIAAGLMAMLGCSQTELANDGIEQNIVERRLLCRERQRRQKGEPTVTAVAPTHIWAGLLRIQYNFYP
jgi:hypothetical protein